MTAASGATRWTDQGFTDALSGSDGTADPPALLAASDVFGDALAVYPAGSDRRSRATVDAVPIDGALAVPPPPAGVRVAPVAGPGRSSSGPRQVVRAAPGARGQVPARGQAAPGTRRVPPAMPPALTLPAQPLRPGQPRRPVQPLRNAPSGRPLQVDRQSFQATFPQALGASSPSATAPAAPMASQYSRRQQIRTDARGPAGSRPRRRIGSTIGSAIVALALLLFASGAGQRVIDYITELLNR